MSHDSLVKVILGQTKTACVTYICVNVISNHWRPIRRLSLAVGWTGHPVEPNRELAVVDVQNLSVQDV